MNQMAGGSTLGCDNSKETTSYEMIEAKKGRKLFFFSGVIVKRRNKINFLGPSASLALCLIGFQSSKNLYLYFRQTG
jgi:hypothetical protein